MIPTIIVAVFSYLLFSFGVQAWFSERVRTAVTDSLAVAEAYLHEHQQTIRADVVSMASDLNRDANLLSINPQRFNQIVEAQAALRSLTEAMVFDGAGRILARTGFSFALELQPVPDGRLQQARAGDVAVLTSDNDDRVRALVRLDRYRRRLSLCRPLRRSEGDQPHEADAERGRAIRAARRRALGITRSRSRCCSSRVGLAAAHRRGLGRPDFRDAHGAADRLAGRRGRAGARRRSRGARAGGRQRRGIRLAVARLQPHDASAPDASRAS